MTLSVAIVGLGQIGMGYDLHLDPAGPVFSHSRAFTLHPDFELIAAIDPDAGRRQAFAERYQRPAYPALDASLELHHPDVVVVSVPTPDHGETVRQVLRRHSPKALLCEKPLADDLAEARAIVEACAAKGVSLFVNYIRRSDCGAIEIRRRIAAGAIAAPIKGVAWYSKGFRHNGSHLFNLLEYWLGPMVDFHVISAGRRLAHGDREPDVQVTFARGPVVFLAAREEAFSHYTVELLAANGRLRYERGGEHIEWQPARPHPQIAGSATLAPVAEPIASSMDRYQWQVAEQLSRAVDGRGGALCPGDDALTTLESMQTILDACGA